MRYGGMGWETDIDEQYGGGVYVRSILAFSHRVGRDIGAMGHWSCQERALQSSQAWSRRACVSLYFLPRRVISGMS